MPSGRSKVRVGAVSFGKAVFAARAIPKGAEVGEVGGKLISDPEYASSYCIQVAEDTTLEPRTPFRYLNHSCEPNCQLLIYDQDYEDGTPAPPYVAVEALRDIVPDEELTIDYAWSLDGAIPCLCGAVQCRGWVVDKELLHQLPVPPRRRPTGPAMTGRARRK